MKHARNDYNERIQDSVGLIPKDEPVFLLRGQDLAAPEAVIHWAWMNEKLGGDPELSKLARIQADEMVKWQTNVKNKIADRPEGA